MIDTITGLCGMAMLLVFFWAELNAAYRNGVRDGLARRHWLPEVKKIMETEFND